MVDSRIEPRSKIRFLKAVTFPPQVPVLRCPFSGKLIWFDGLLRFDHFLVFRILSENLWLFLLGFILKAQSNRYKNDWNVKKDNSLILHSKWSSKELGWPMGENLPSSIARWNYTSTENWFDVGATSCEYRLLQSYFVCTQNEAQGVDLWGRMVKRISLTGKRLWRLKLAQVSGRSALSRDRASQHLYRVLFENLR